MFITSCSGIFSRLRYRFEARPVRDHRPFLFGWAPNVACARVRIDMNVRASVFFCSIWIVSDWLRWRKSGGPAVSPLAGNWLITGPMPTNVLQLAPLSGFRLAMTFDVTGNNLKASGFTNQPCSNQDPSSPIFDFVGIAYSYNRRGNRRRWQLHAADAS